PLVRVQVETSLRSADITARVRRFELDAGVIYPDPQDTEGLTITELYEERQVLLAGGDLLAGRTDSIGWSDALELPMCLLTPGMRGRRLIDEALADRGLAVIPRLESDSVVVLLTHVATGRWATVVPQTWLDALPPPAGVRALTLDGPPVTARVVLVTNAAQPGSVLARALIQTAKDMSSSKGP
ncbi:MAG: LysR family transcriptional regulator substrate-binding protein, partial [Mycolicibacterium sp.]|nr:LysR family transcriptional regulator substrate-binding protein [Mycolicibacterium sp.]